MKMALKLFTLLLALTPVAGTSQSAPSSIEALLLDQDKNNIPDRLGKTVRITGTLISHPALYDKHQRSRVFVQDQTAGIRIFTNDQRLVTGGYDVGQVISVTGKLEVDDRGRIQVNVQVIDGIFPSTVPVPVQATSSSIHAGRHRGQLVQLRGELRLIDDPRLDHEGLLKDEDGEMAIDIPDRILLDPEFFPSLANTSSVQTTGIVDWSEGAPMVRLREIGDIKFIPAPPYGIVIITAIGSLLLFVMLHLRSRRRAAESRAHETSRLMEQVKRSEERYRDLVENTSDIAWETDSQGVFTYCSPNTAPILGYASTDLVGKTPFDLMPPSEGERVGKLFSEIVREKRPFSLLEHEAITADGRTVIIECGGRPILDHDGNLLGYRGIDRDITRRKELEKQLAQVQKMEAVGNLAGGIAHDFNNILTVIFGYNQLLLDSSASESIQEKAGGIRMAAERAAQLTRQLLAFGRRQVLQPQLLDLNVVIRKTAEMLGRLIPENIEIQTCFGRKLRAVTADPTQIEQILINLAVNARDAMSSGGRLTIETRNVEINSDQAANVRFASGRYVCLAVRDTGVGMTAEVRARIFEPFFTTKEVGKGTGLGLATVYGIVRQSGGQIVVESTPGEGATFFVYFPASDTTVFSHEESAYCGRPTKVKTATVLVVEDELQVRKLLAEALRAAGHTVFEAEDGQQGLKLCTENARQVEVLVSDIVMPKMSGPELALHATRLRPDMKLIYMSGHAVTNLHSGDTWPDAHAFLDKPFTPDALLLKIQEVLQADPFARVSLS